MSKFIWLKRSGKSAAIALPHDHAEMLASWSGVRSRMVRFIHPDFSRSEWAYLISFIDPHALARVFADSFGEAVPGPIDVEALLTPNEKVALWLPNNVSLLGPLTVILLSLTGCKLRVKAGSRSRDLCTSLVAWLRDHVASGPLKTWLQESVEVRSFDRTDQRNAEMAAWADVRILFGGNEAAEAIDRLPHPYESQGFYFSNKVSEAWIDPAFANDELAQDLARVFGIYGQAGCTSPKRVVLLNGTRDDAIAFAGKLDKAWLKANPEQQPRHVASETALAVQWARALGREAISLDKGQAVAIVGPVEPVAVTAHMALAVQWGTLEQTLATQRDNLQTIGHALAAPSALPWLAAVADSPALRFVPLQRMHHFGPVWDGQAWWGRLFREHTIEAN
ncbi:acyl-CoA reductase [Massilia sp. LjRoot122]|uniref:acyl-CoA reductase n=1 Tax=Massilia sp. LjRoot122 TaxID=3342257 RepID=UPI003ECC961C